MRNYAVPIKRIKGDGSPLIVGVGLCKENESRGGEGELGGGRWGKMGIVGEKGGIIVKAAAQIDSNFAVRLLVIMRLDVSQLVGKLETSHT